MSYKVIIVDDKPLIRQALVKTIKWEQLDCEIVGEAENGIIGKKLVDEYSPDIVITDIKMPGIDGLEFSEYITAQLWHTKIIMITGYQEFEYAKKAISIGVFELALKPIDNAKLENIIQNAIIKIKEEKAFIKKQEDLLKQNSLYKIKLGQSLHIERNNFIGDVITGRKKIEECTESKLQELKFENLKYVVIISRIKSGDDNVITHVQARQKEILLEKQDTHYIDINDVVINKDIVFIVWYRDTQISARQIKISISDVLYNTLEVIKKETNINCFMTISSIYNRFMDIKEGYRQASILLDTYYFSAQKDFLFASEDQIMRGLDRGDVIRELDKFYKAIEHLSDDEMNAQIEAVVEKIVQHSGRNIFMIKCLLSEICITLIRHYWVTQHDETQFNKNINTVMNEIDALSGVVEATKYLKTFVNHIKVSAQAQPIYSNPIIKDAIQYIDENYNKDITLDTLAKYLSVNASYLSRLLKKETRKNFIDILTSIRVNGAKRLLNESNYKIAEVSKAVGYSDYVYFYQVFKKVEGISPSEYKKRGKKI